MNSSLSVEFRCYRQNILRHLIYGDFDDIHVRPILLFTIRNITHCDTDAVFQINSESVPGISAEEGIYLWVFEANYRTRKFYERLGANLIERSVTDAPGGGKVAEWRYAWESVIHLNMAVAKD